MKVIFAGTPEFAAQHLRALINSGEHEICAVYTQPDRPAGRGKKLTSSPVKTLALEHAIPVLQPKSLKDEGAQSELAAFDCDLMIVVAYGLILPKAVLDSPKHGCINVHASILPRWRGAAPIQRAIEAGDTSTGVTIMQMDVGLDTGDMLLTTSCEIQENDTAAKLHDRLVEIGQPALIAAVKAIEEGAIQAQKQDDKLSNYASKIEKAEAEIQWSESATTIHRKIRAFNPFPICFSELKGERLRIHSAQMVDASSKGTPGSLKIAGEQIVVQCGEGSLALDSIQLPGKKACDAKTFLNGFGHLLEGDIVLGGT